MLHDAGVEALPVWIVDGALWSEKYRHCLSALNLLSLYWPDVDDTADLKDLVRLYVSFENLTLHFTWCITSVFPMSM